MTHLLEAFGWLILFIASLLAAVFIGSFCWSLIAPLAGAGTDPHGLGRVLPVVGFVLFALPGMLVGWGLVSYAKRKRSAS